MSDEVRGRRAKLMRWAAAIAGTVSAVGCGGDARVMLSAADSIGALRDSLSATVEEYRSDLERLDDGREESVAWALVERIRKIGAESSEAAAPVAAFQSALGRIRADRRVAVLDARWLGFAKRASVRPPALPAADRAARGVRTAADQHAT